MTAADHANTPAELAFRVRQCEIDESRDFADLTPDALAALDALQTQAEEWREIGEAFLEAWWEWEPGDDTDALDKAASEAMSLRGDVIRLARPKDES